MVRGMYNTTHAIHKGRREQGDVTMKTAARYEIREYVGMEFSRSMSAKLRTRQAATKLIKRLKKLGHNAFAAKYMISI